MRFMLVLAAAAALMLSIVGSASSHASYAYPTSWPCYPSSPQVVKYADGVALVCAGGVYWVSHPAH